MDLTQYATSAVTRGGEPITAESILETMRLIPKVEPLRVTTRQFEALRRHYAIEMSLQPNPLSRWSMPLGVPVHIDDENPTVPDDE